MLIGKTITGKANLFLLERVTQFRPFKRDLAREPEASAQRNGAQPIGVGEIISVIGDAGFVDDGVLIGLFSRPPAAGAGKPENKRDISPPAAFASPVAN